MKSEYKTKIFAAIATLLVVLIVILLLVNSHLHYSENKIAMADKSTLVLDEEFVDVMDLPPLPDMEGDNPAKAQADEQQDAKPTPESGTNLTDQGEAGKAPNMVTKKEESPAKVTEKKKDDKKVGATDDKKKKEEEEIKRKADNEVANAFNKASGKNNANAGTQDNGKSGTADGTAVSGTLLGTGTGSVGGGWVMPNYGKVRSTVTGSVYMIVKIDRNGKVKSVSFGAGKAPAATNKAVRDACEKEVRSRRFTRNDPENAPDETTAYITYTFK